MLTNNPVAHAFSYSKKWYPVGGPLEACEGHLYHQTNGEHLVHGPKTLNLRSLLSHFTVLGKTKHDRAGVLSRKDPCQTRS